MNYDKEGYFYMSFNWLNEVWKIDPKSGKVIYRLGGKVEMFPFPMKVIPTGCIV